MALRFSATHITNQEESSDPEYSETHPGESSSEDEDEDLTWDDWVSDSLSKRPCKSLFENRTFDTVQEALAYDETTHGSSLKEITARLRLDPYKRIRLINWIRKEHPSSSEVANLTGSEPFFTEDEYLKPSIEDDPLLQIEPDDWSDSDEEAEQGTLEEPKDLDTAKRQIKALQRKLQQATQDLVYYHQFVSERLNLAGLADELQKGEGTSSASHVAVPLRDDDSHYFQSYAENDIHSVMINDKVRTASYAKFILSNPELFRDAVVMDVGCGTGILSLFAASAGAKRVFAIDASDIAEKAEKIVKANGLDNVITVIRGKVENIKLPEGFDKVDIIVSEWMGYALLYESMLDSVLHARDRFLKDGGVMAPSQTKMMFALCEASELFKERIGFWNDVYGFDLSEMGSHVYDDAVVDVVGPDTVVSQPVEVKDLYLGSITPKQLDFSSPFKLVSTSERRIKVHAFVLYFDTFFTNTGAPIPDDVEAYVIHEGDPILAEVWPLGGRPYQGRRMSTGGGLTGRPKVTSFSTGPASMPTHWKQTIFFLREPISVADGTVVEGMFKCKKSTDNSRELDVEIHFSVREPDADAGAGDVVVQIYKVR
ncbi:protein arginine N-methyltransferase [Dichomitus squalens]|uniref:type I protein arginine methyltransferase n=2 Tax=Dichomitus squalens TaxID=114155 RepID=A0A4Q9NR24_9APHY|nr:protein arginine N-methyltransferase [Dichomitus squalens LYAD-421 SS1]EJF55863.1 protein arginine N-methyltransferase [Dichomitus squalens LYAD-421 SS1]TBU44029.1 protein arginine N-methyltransferase [Dichomitus squalens]TBU54460.1 protein arginine N-methyltransferase [Dichomitus squalens]